MNGGRWSVLLVALLVACPLSWLAVESGGFGRTVGGADLYAAFLSKHRYVAETFLAGRLPLWNPYEFTGAPLLGWAQGSVFYVPVPLANMVLPTNLALQVLYHAHIFAAVVATLLYLRRAGIHLLAGAPATALAVACIFNSQGKVGVDHPLLLFSVWLIPVILLAWDALLAGRPGAAALAALSLGIQWLPGYPEVSMDVAVLFLVTAALSRGWTVGRRMAAAVGLLATGALIAGIQLVPLAEAVSQSARLEWPGWAVSLSAFGVQSARGLFAEGLARYGMGGLFCIVLGILTGAGRRRVWTACLCWTVFATNRPFVFLYDFPPYSALRFAWAWDMIEAFFAGCLVAAGLQAAFARRSQHHRWTAAAVGGALAAIALVAGERRAAGAAAACAVATVPAVRHGVGGIVPAALVVLHAAGIMSGVGMAFGTVPRHQPPDLEALKPQVELLRSLRESLPNAPRVVSPKELMAGLFLTEEIPSPTGYDPSLPPRRIFRVNQHLGLAAPKTPVWSSLAGSPQVAAAVGIGLVTPRHQDAGRLLKAGYAAHAVMPDGRLVLYRRPVPRFHVVHTVAHAADEEDAFAKFSAPDFDPWTTVILEERVVVADEPAGREPVDEPVALVVDAAERTVLRLTLARAGVLVVADTFFPGWSARIDGEPAELLRANYAFRALVLEPGPHEVELAYRPASLWIGTLLSAAGLCLVVGMTLLGVRRGGDATMPAS